VCENVGQAVFFARIEEYFFFKGASFSNKNFVVCREVLSEDKKPS
jgi:hypothetical protein